MHFGAGMSDAPAGTPPVRPSTAPHDRPRGTAESLGPPDATLAIPDALRWLTPRYTFVPGAGAWDGDRLSRAHARQRRGGGHQGYGPSAGRRSGSGRALRPRGRLVTGLEHPNIVRTLAIETSGDAAADAVAIVSEYVAGETLRDALQRIGPFSFDRAASVLRDVAAALAYAHAARFVHRDVKPENIFLETGTGHALLGDFGIARPLDADALLTQAGASLGTPAYMAPEQVDGRPVDERTDVYALGLVGWEMLTGRRPWQGESLYTLLQKQRTEALPDLARLRPDVPVYLHRAIEGALAKHPADRWPSADAMLQHLAPVPERVEDAFATRPTSDADEGELAELTSGATIRVDSGRFEADPSAPASALAVSPERYLRDEAEIAALPPRRRPRPVGRWIGAAVLAALLGCAAWYSTVERPRDASSGDRQLDSLLALTAASEPPRESPRARPETAATRGAPALRRGVVRAPAAVAPRWPPAGHHIGWNSCTVAARLDSAPPHRGHDDQPRGGRACRAPHRPCRSTATDAQRRCLMQLVDRNDVPLNRAYVTLIRALRRKAGARPSHRACTPSGWSSERGWTPATGSAPEAPPRHAARAGARRECRASRPFPVEGPRRSQRA